MSRKSKRRRMNHSQPGAGHDGFDFLDDRDPRTARVLVAPVTALPPSVPAQPAAPVPAAPAPLTARPVIPSRIKPNTSPSLRSIRDVPRGRHEPARESTNGPVAAAGDVTAPLVAVRDVIAVVAAPPAVVQHDVVPAVGPDASGPSSPTVAESLAATASPAPVAEGEAAAAGPAVDVAAQETTSLPAGPTVGELLIAAREGRGLSLEAASTRTRMSSKMLGHLENDRFDEFAADAYVRGFLRSYGSFLGLDLTTLLQRYDETVAVAAPARQAPVVETASVVDLFAARTIRRGYRGWIATAAAVVVAIGGAATWMLQRSSIELRAPAGLEQIETELRASNPVHPATAPAARLETAPATAPGVISSEDTAAPAPASVASAVPFTASAPSPHDGSLMTDLVEIPAASMPRGRAEMSPVVVGSSLPAAVGSAAPLTAKPAEPLRGAVRTGDNAAGVVDAVVLTATATGPCVLRLVTDGETRRGIPYTFSRAGESRSWTARRGFRMVARNGQNLQLTLNGRAIATPPDGRAVSLDRSTLEPAGAQPAAHRRRPRPRPRPAGAAPAANAAPAIESHGGVIPPR